MSKLGLGLGVDSGLKASAFTEIVEPPYILGGEGEISGSVIYNQNAEGSEWYETTSGTGLYYVDPTDAGFTALYSLADAKTAIEGLTSEGYSDWEVVSIIDPNEPYDLLVTGYDMDNSMIGSFMFTHVSLAGPIISILTGGELNDIEDWDETKLTIAFEDIDGTCQVCTVDLPETGTRMFHIMDLQNWTLLPLLTGLGAPTLGFIAGAQDPETDAYVSKVFVATHRVNETEATGVPRLPAPAASINVYDDPAVIPHGLTPNVLVAYGDVLEASRLYNTVDRYRTHEQILDDAPVSGAASTLRMLPPMDNTQSLDENLVSVVTANQQVEIKIYTLVQGVPEGVWNNPASGEVLYARAKFTCLRNSDGTEALLQALSVSSTDDAPLEVQSESPTSFTVTIGGVEYTGKVHAFKFDISGLKVYSTSEERAALGISGTATVNDLAFQGSSDVYTFRSMICKLESLTFHSNLRNPTRNLVNAVKTARRIIVPTIKTGGAIVVGTDVGAFVLDQQTTNNSGAKGSLVLSMEQGEAAPAETVDDFTFEFTVTQTTDLAHEFAPTNPSTIVAFDNKVGAFSQFNRFVYLNNVDQVTDFGGTVTIEIDRSLYSAGNAITPDLELYVSENEISGAISTSSSNVGDVYTYTFTIDYTHQLTGNSNYSLSEDVYLRMRVTNNTANDVVTMTVKANSTFTGQISADSSGPTTPPGDLLTPPPPVLRYNQY